MINLKNVVSLSLALSVILSASQAEAMKRSWQEIFTNKIEYENYEAAAAAAREPKFYDHDEVKVEPSGGLPEYVGSVHRITIPSFLVPGFTEWWGSEDHLRSISDQDISRSIANRNEHWHPLEQKREAQIAEQARLAAAAQAQVASEDPQPDEMEDFDNQIIYIPFDQNYLEYLNYLHYLEYFNYLYSVWNLHPRSPLWPIMAPNESTEIKTSGVADIQKQAAQPFNTPGHSSDSDSSRKSSVDLCAHPADGHETDSDRENDNRAQPQKGKRHGSVKLPASEKFVATYKKLSETFSGGALNRAIMKELGMDRATLLLLLDKARYDAPGIFKPAKRTRR